MTLQTNFYFLSPVEVVKVTPKNIEEVAEWCGGKVAETESRRVEGRMDKYVWVPTPKGTAISWAFPGMFITKRVVITEKDEIKVTFSVFRKDYFKANFFQSPEVAVDKTWERQARAAITNITNGKIVTPKDLKEQLTGQIKDDVAEGSLIVEFNPPKTEPNGLMSMVAQREAIVESAVEKAAAGDPDRP
jgi:hypothetical protein